MEKQLDKEFCRREIISIIENLDSEGIIKYLYHFIKKAITVWK